MQKLHQMTFTRAEKLYEHTNEIILGKLGEVLEENYVVRIKLSLSLCVCSWESST